ncbi:alpha/beta hydrolase fold domain-containing protein [Arthrobacter sp. ISL-48]|uniref:alpha/beta hydrolase n=1 Tax=Arthrobacter sp. ISL-48 TaxID=2819110 RepID=UPI001BEC706C|nr:alpha/beta hydrolase [Arthrobacter sp. ISL-48]MBT2533927.1 alpha/beta hydrolase fold domain-containing protein [Arthrobacter sp. ISL-48]
MTSDISARPGAEYLREKRLDVPWADTFVQGADGVDIRMRVYEPAARPSVTLVWAHGGSWTRGSIEGWHEACAALAALGTARILSVGYRLAPRWLHPTAVMDIAAATLWAQQTYRHPVLVGGDSAGGTLAAGVALWFRDNGLPLDGQVLAYPPLDPECTADSYRESRSFPPRSLLLDAWGEYAGSGADLRERLYLSPLHAPKLTGLCPVSLIVGTTDPVRDDVEQFAQRLIASSVPVDLAVSPAVAHGHFLDSSLANPVHHWIQTRLSLPTNRPPTTDGA